MPGLKLSPPRLILSAALVGLSSPAAALPIGFGVNQGDMEYAELKSDHFIIYLDRRAPAEAALTLNALETARPFLEHWMDQHRPDPLPVVMSAQTENASFANPITDALEIQTLGQGTKDLAWHEYTHSTMYRAFDTFLGRSYDLLPLVPMPAWFLEGLAETTSVSANSDITAGIERYQALSGNWPSYDRLHSLYSSANFAERGYATSGALVTYLLQRGGPNKLPELLHSYFSYLNPWYWLGSVLPNNLPLDHALTDYIGRDGQETYEDYKLAAKKYWDGAYPGRFLVGDKGNRLGFRGLFGLRTDGSHITSINHVFSDLTEMTINFDDKTGWATEWKESTFLTDAPQTMNVMRGKEFQARVRYLPDPPQDMSILTLTRLSGKGKGKKRDIERKGAVYTIWETPTDIAWYEQQQSVTRLCETAKAGGSIRCPLTFTIPEQLRALGERLPLNGSNDKVAQELWFATGVQKLTGTTYEVKVYDTRKHAVTHSFSTGLAQPLSAAFAGKGGSDLWLLVAERDRRTLRHVSPEGQCLGMITLRDHILDVKGLANGDLVLALYGGHENYLRRLKPSEQQATACAPYSGHVSPLQYAISHDSKGTMDMATALSGASLWQEVPPAETAAATKTADASPTADKDIKPGTHTELAPQPTQFRARPLFIFPWIGANDAYGMQLGVVSVPLMDHMQNETVRATFLYGPTSHFPDTEIALTSTRFRPTLNFVVYRQQSYDGILSNGVVERTEYFDEKGVRAESLLGFHLLGGMATGGAAIKYVYLKPFIGFMHGLREGFLVEPAGSLSLVHAVGRYTLSNQISGRIAPAAFNKHFDYNQLGFSSTLAIALPLFSKLDFGVEYSRTRGPKRRELQELYLPLKTFIPGSGGGYNQNSYPLSNTDSGLFDPLQSETQGRLKTDYTVPLIRDIDKEWWLLYFERLDFTAFYNYGAAWRGNTPREGWNKLERAQGYSLDMNMENKGVHFNLGLGAGEVVGYHFAPYINAGFDALF